MELITLLVAAGALILGLLAGWWAGRIRGRSLLEADRAELQARALAAEAETRTETDRRRELETTLATVTSEKAELDRNLARTQEQVEQITRAAAEQKQFLEDSRKELEDSFRSLAATALKGNTEQFLDLADQRLATAREQASKDLEARQQGIQTLLAPFRETLGKLETRTGEIEKAREGAYQGLTKELTWLRDATTSLRDQTTGLTRALRGSQVRGKWGEIALRNVVELAGMTEHCDFIEQSDAEGLRPDMVVRLPGQRAIAVDAKAPMAAFLSASETEDETLRLKAMDDHVRAIRTHVKDLSARDYASRLDADTDLVVLFLPGDPFLSAAFARDPDLQVDALRAKVLIATPTTLVALLRTVAIYWQQQSIAENAELIAEVARELYERGATFGEHLAKTGKGLHMAVEAYNSAVGSFKSRFLPVGQKLQDLKAVESPKRPLEAPKEIDEVPRDVPHQVPLDLG